jgi:hypothetical protein
MGDVFCSAGLDDPAVRYCRANEVF